jgi:hypothetical protein
MKSLLLLLVVSAACGDNTTTTEAPPTCQELGCENALCNRKGECACDGVGCVIARTADACVPPSYGSDDCCALMPDEQAAVQCASAQTPSGTCGVLACETSTCGFIRLNFCGTKAP